MDAILEIAQNHDLTVIEDAACALGAKYKDKFAGAIGDIGCFSFHARKGITTGEGGMLVTNDDEIAQRARELSTFGTEAGPKRDGAYSPPSFVHLGYNYKMSDITAAIGVAQLRRLDTIIEQKRNLARYWDSQLDEIKGIKKPYVDSRTFSIYQSYVALIKPSLDRNKLIQDLMSNGVQAQIGTYASHLQPVYTSNDTCPNSKEIFDRAIALPMFYTLKEDDIDYVCNLLKKCLM